MDQSAPNQFCAALAYLLDQEGRGAQTRLADQQKIDRGYLNAIVKGRKSGSEKKRSEIAAHFGMVYEDMLALGRRILDGEDDPSRRKQAGDSPLPQDFIDNDEGNRAIDFKINPINGPGSDNISKRIIGVLEVLGSGTAYADLLAGLIDAFQDSVSTKKKLEQLEDENLELRTKLKEMDEMKSRIASLELRQDGEKENLRKTA